MPPPHPQGRVTLSSVKGDMLRPPPFSAFVAPVRTQSALLDEQMALIRRRDILLGMMRTSLAATDDGGVTHTEKTCAAIARGQISVEEALAQLEAEETEEAEEAEGAELKRLAGNAMEFARGAAADPSARGPTDIEAPAASVAARQAEFIDSIHGWTHRRGPPSRPAYSFHRVERFSPPNYGGAGGGPAHYHPNFHASSTNPPPPTVSFSGEKRFQQHKEGRGGSAAGAVPYVGISPAHHRGWFSPKQYDPLPQRAHGLHSSIVSK